MHSILVAGCHRSQFLLRQTLPWTPDKSLSIKGLMEFCQFLLLELCCRLCFEAGSLGPQSITLNRSDVHSSIPLACSESQQYYPPVTPLASFKICSSTKATTLTRGSFFICELFLVLFKIHIGIHSFLSFVCPAADLIFFLTPKICAFIWYPSSIYL